MPPSGSSTWWFLGSCEISKLCVTSGSALAWHWRGYNACCVWGGFWVRDVISKKCGPGVSSPHCLAGACAPDSWAVICGGSGVEGGGQGSRWLCTPPPMILTEPSSRAPRPTTWPPQAPVVQVLTEAVYHEAGGSRAAATSCGAVLPGRRATGSAGKGWAQHTPARSPGHTPSVPLLVPWGEGPEDLGTVGRIARVLILRSDGREGRGAPGLAGESRAGVCVV